MKAITCRTYAVDGRSILQLLVLVLCLALSPSQGCKKDETIGGPPIDGTPSRPVINRILLSAWDTSWTGSPRQQLCTVNPDGSDLRRITNSTTEPVAYLCGVWSPDLSRLAVAWNYTDMRRGEYPFLSLVDTSGNFLAALSATFFFPSQVVWSPAGSQIAFAAPQTPFGGSSEVYVVNANGGSPQKVRSVTQGQADTSALVYGWTSNNTLLTIILHWHSTEYGGALWEMDLGGRLTRKIFEDSARMPLSALNLGGITVCQYAVSGASGLFAVDSADTTARLLRPELHYLDTWQEYTGMVLSPDGKSLCFAVSADPPSYVGPKHTEVYVLDLATGVEHVILRVPYARVCDWR